MGNADFLNKTLKRGEQKPLIDKNFKEVILAMLRAAQAQKIDSLMPQRSRDELSITELIWEIEQETPTGVEHLKLFEDAALLEYKRRNS